MNYTDVMADPTAAVAFLSSLCHIAFTLPLWVPPSIAPTISPIKRKNEPATRLAGWRSQMGTKVKLEYVAAGLRQQIESLSHVVQDMERETLGEEAIGWRLKAVELGLRRLREAA
jgi:hypothetical protein